MQRSFLTATLISGLACCAVMAQNNLEAEIPFQFHVGHTLMPAGKYHVKQSPVGTLTLRHTEKPKAVMTQTLPGVVRDPVGTAGLRFHRYGDTYFLVKLWTLGTNSARDLFTSKMERDLANSSANVQTAGIPLRGR
ncbi:MAG: hypothetical protein H7039_24375 [Bryobacteraceae bacterium]|nr:hypothetical protein [Bryobacteraceae bacterium]